MVLTVENKLDYETTDLNVPNIVNIMNQNRTRVSNTLLTLLKFVL